MGILYYQLGYINNTCMSLKLLSGIKDVFYLQMTTRSVYIKLCMCNHFNVNDSVIIIRVGKN